MDLSSTGCVSLYKLLRLGLSSARIIYYFGLGGFLVGPIRTLFPALALAPSQCPPLQRNGHASTRGPVLYPPPAPALARCQRPPRSSAMKRQLVPYQCQLAVALRYCHVDRRHCSYSNHSNHSNVIMLELQLL